MNTNHQEHTPGASPVRSRRWWAVPVFLILLALSMGAVNLRFAQLANRAVESLRMEGFPVNAIELDKWYEVVPENDNAALRVIAAGSWMSRPEGWDAAFPRISLVNFRKELSAEQRSLLEQFLASNQEALGEVRAAASMERSRYPINLKEGYNALLPDLSQVKRLAQDQGELARYYADEGRPADAVQCLREIHGLARTLKDEPVLISQLVRIACHAIGHRVLERVLNSCQLSEPQLEELEMLLLRAEKENVTGVKRGLHGELAMGLDLFRRSFRVQAGLAGVPANGLGGSPVTWVLLGLRKALGLDGVDQAFLVRHMQKAIAVCDLPFPEQLEQWKRIDAALMTQLKDGRRLFYTVSSMVVPALGKAGERTADCTAQLRVARCAVAIERFRLAHQGRLPANLEELVPELDPAVLRDPCTGLSLVYKQDGGGYQLYSLGLDARADEKDATGSLSMRVERGFENGSRPEK